jgi:hypothetical protein
MKKAPKLSKATTKVNFTGGNSSALHHWRPFSGSKLNSTWPQTREALWIGTNTADSVESPPAGARHRFW